MSDAVKCDWCGKFAEVERRPDPFTMNGYRFNNPLPDGWVRVAGMQAPFVPQTATDLEIECCSWECASRRVSWFGDHPFPRPVPPPGADVA